MVVPKEIIDLVEKYRLHRNEYLDNDYKEYNLRKEFIDPFFKALGWDMDNSQGFSEAYKDVVYEDSIEVEDSTRAPDYCFRLGGVRKYFVEAKKPSVKLNDAPKPAFQLRRYAWSAKLPLSILTNFEEFAVYDTYSVKPVVTDKASKARVMYLTYEQYIEKWDDIAAIFSRSAIPKGLFDDFAKKSDRRRGTTKVDKAFLEEIESWRDSLARNIAIRNLQINNRELNFVVQATIDRIIFLRICEDRGIEKYGRLRNLLDTEKIYSQLCELYRQADNKYNSGLFHFEQDDISEPADELSFTLQIDDKIFKDIIKNLYPPDSPYEFSVIPADILGQVYERFLGKIIKLTPAHHAVVEYKPELEQQAVKAGGVFYTPEYVVHYIVNNTVGKTLEGKTPREVSSISILDPACGSGSFLIAAYQYLLDWHCEWYNKYLVPLLVNGKAASSAEVRRLTPEPTRKRKTNLRKNSPENVLPVYQTGKGEWQLTTAERRRILLNSIYGVDIDRQAIEVTKLSLLMKVLEGENNESISIQLKLFQERALPDLGNNIKCGNSLIGTDYNFGGQMNLVNEDEMYKVNIFSWERAFPEIIQKGGFNIIIGNPPYIPIELMPDFQKSYFQNHYPELTRKYDTSIVFILAMLQKLAPKGLLGFISSITWQTGENFSKVRELLFTKYGLVELVNLPFDTFENAYVDTGIYVLSNEATDHYQIHCFPKKDKYPSLAHIPFEIIPRTMILPPDYKIVLNLLARILYERANADNTNFYSLGTITKSTQGLAGNKFKLKPEPINDNWYPFFNNGQVYRYHIDKNGSAYTDMSEYPSLKEYYDAKPKILIRRIINRDDRLMAMYSDDKMVYTKDTNPFIVVDSEYDPMFMLGIINSKLISFLYLGNSSIATKDDFRQTTLAELRKLPIPRFIKINTKHQALISYVKQRINLEQIISNARTSQDKEFLSNQIIAVDQQIDDIVFDLYNIKSEKEAINKWIF